jgi:hypothetical protein
MFFVKGLRAGTWVTTGSCLSLLGRWSFGDIMLELMELVWELS